MLLTLVSMLAVATGSLEECKRLDEQFDTKGMVAVCEAAATSTDSPANRAEALRLLAVAQVTNGNDEAAQAAFLRLLVLAPGTWLSSESSPRVRSSFDAAAKQLASDGPVTAAMSPLLAPELSGPVQVEVSVSDPLRRVASMRIELAAGEQRGVVPLAPEAGGSQATRTYRGVIEPIDGVVGVDWQVVAIGQSGGAIAMQEPVGGHYEQVEGGLPIIPIAAAVGVVVIGAASVAGVLVYRNCCAPTNVKIDIN